MQARLILGCHGHRRYGFSMCKGTKNCVLELDKLGSDTDEILDYLEHHCKLFEKVVSESNAVNNTMQYVIRRELVPEHIKKLIYEYITMHKTCGLYLYVEPNTAD